MDYQVSPWTERNNKEAVRNSAAELGKRFEAFLERTLSGVEDKKTRQFQGVEKLPGVEFGHVGYDKPNNDGARHCWVRAAGVEGLGVMLETWNRYPGRWMVTHTFKGAEHLEAFEKLGYVD